MFPGLLCWSIFLLGHLWFLTRLLPSVFPRRMQCSTLIFLYFLLLSFITLPHPHSFHFLTRSLSRCITSLLSHNFSSVICICSLNDLNLQEVLIIAFILSSAFPSCSLPSPCPSYEDMRDCVLCFPSFSSLLLWPLFSSILEGYEKIGHSGEMAQQLKWLSCKWRVRVQTLLIHTNTGCLFQSLCKSQKAAIGRS